MHPRALFAMTVAAGLLLAPVPEAAAQGDRVSGATLQAWLDQKFTYAGLHHPSGCHLLNTAAAQGRTLFLACPNGWTATLAGTARVEGDTLCTRFPVPNTPGAEECFSWHRVDGARYEQRSADGVNTSLYLLSDLRR